MEIESYKTNIKIDLTVFKNTEKFVVLSYLDKSLLCLLEYNEDGFRSSSSICEKCNGCSDEFDLDKLTRTCLFHHVYVRRIQDCRLYLYSAKVIRESIFSYKMILKLLLDNETLGRSVFYKMQY